MSGHHDPAVERRQCKVKQRYLTKEEALARARSLHKSKKARYNVYECKFCGFFHVGMQRSQQAAIRRAERMAAKA